MKEKMLSLWKAHKRMLILCFAAVFVCGLAAHGYAMLNFQLSHDSLDGLYAAGHENAHKIELGRVLAPAYRFLFRGQFAMPWLTGLTALVWTALGAWIMTETLEIRSRLQTVLICGLLTVNLSVTALSGTFIHDWDQNMFGMMTACLAALVWRKRSKGWLVIGAAASSVCLGIYQAFISVTIGLIMIVCLLRLIRGEKWLAVMKDAVLGAVMVGIGGVIFLGMVKGITEFTGIPLADRNNSLTMLRYLGMSSIPRLIRDLYRNVWEYFVYMPNTWMIPQMAGYLNKLVMIAVCVLLAGCMLLRKKLPVVNAALAVLIVLALPFGLNVCYLLTSGFVHHLMQYAFALVYVLCLLLAAETDRLLPEKRRYSQIVCCALAAMVLWGGVQTANTYHFQKTSSVLATGARMNNVYHDMLENGYLPGETPLVVIGEVPVEIPDGFEQSTLIWPGEYPNAITSDTKSIRSYFSFVLGDDAAFLTGEEWSRAANDPYVQAMPCYPAEGYVDMLDGVMIVKLW